MKRDEVIAALEANVSELDGILSRYTRDNSGIHIHRDDERRFRAMVLELKNLFADEFVDARSHTQPLVAYFNDSITNYLNSPSYAGVQSVRGVVSAALMRVKRNPLALRKHAALLEKSGAKDPDLVVRLVDRLHVVIRQLRRRREGRPTLNVDDEYDLQDLVHALFLIDFDDVRKEEWSPSYAGGASRMDFLLPEIESVVELKKSRPSMTAKELGDQLIIDITRYKTHPMCRTLYCVIYDPEGRIANPRGVENDLNSETSELAVRVMVVPK